MLMTLIKRLMKKSMSRTLGDKLDKCLTSLLNDSTTTSLIMGLKNKCINRMMSTFSCRTPVFDKFLFNNIYRNRTGTLTWNFAKKSKVWWDNWNNCYLHLECDIFALILEVLVAVATSVNVVLQISVGPYLDLEDWLVHLEKIFRGVTPLWNYENW